MVVRTETGSVYEITKEGEATFVTRKSKRDIAFMKADDTKHVRFQIKFYTKPTIGEEIIMKLCDPVLGNGIMSTSAVTEIA